MGVFKLTPHSTTLSEAVNPANLYEDKLSCHVTYCYIPLDSICGLGHAIKVNRVQLEWGWVFRYQELNLATK